MSRPPRDALSALTELLHRRPELAGIGIAAAAEVVTA